MEESSLWIFHPPRQRGIWINGAALIVNLAVLGIALVQLTEQRPGPRWLLWLVLALLGGIASLGSGYRLAALWRATYTIDRDGLRLRWGLRVEHLPLESIEWIRPGNEAGFPLPLPPFAWPGAILGSRKVPELGDIEFLAAETTTLLLIATPQRVFAISPEDPSAFSRAFRQALELGSLNPLPPYSARPVAFVVHLWQDRIARAMVIGGILLLLGLLSLGSLLAASRATIVLGYSPPVQPPSPLPAQRLMLLPILGALTYGSGLILGLYFYRQKEGQAKSYLLWGGGDLALILLTIACVLAGLR
ncbi:MAG: PH domain-containing protein [Thermanaerothrix sp.]|uniref:PH domain-containing protein n=1 Tax=Thermanaerothrix sp. TaxID=2972675 RepID=UPI003C7B3187